MWWCALLRIILYSLKPLDIEFMKQLHNLVNIVPVIAKADTLTAPELKRLKLRVRVVCYFYMCIFAV